MVVEIHISKELQRAYQALTHACWSLLKVLYACQPIRLVISGMLWAGTLDTHLTGTEASLRVHDSLWISANDSAEMNERRIVVGEREAAAT